MNKRCLILAAAVCLSGTTSRAFDTVKTTSETIIGVVTSISRFEVELEKNNIPQKIPVNQIVTIYFDDEPTLLKTARSYLISGRYNDASEALDKVPPEDIENSKTTEQDVKFYQALCAAKLALGGTGTIADAGKKMSTFVRENTTSYHFLEGCEMVGDLYVALGYYAQAQKYYEQLGNAPWPDYKMRAAVAVGRAQLAQEKYDDALQSFESVLAMDASGDLAQSQHLAATLGKARCLAATGQPDQAIKMVEGILEKADPEQVELHALAYNTLGTALRKAGKNKGALLAFLHVDVLYFTVPEAHAEALFHLAELWDAEHKTERAVRCRQLLAERYRNSRWAKRGGS